MFPEFVDLSALRDGRDQTVWPKNLAPPLENQHDHVEYDPNNPMFAQMGLLHNALGAELVDFLKGSESAEQALSDVEAVYETAAKDAGYL